LLANKNFGEVPAALKEVGNCPTGRQWTASITVVGQRANIMRKLGIHNRTELVKYAIRKSIVSLDS
jgi:hypothetical protein